MVTLSRTCVACRKLIPEDYAGNMLTIATMEVKWNNKKHRHVGKIKHGEHSCFCEECAKRMGKIIKDQAEKGVKVL